MQNLCSVSEEVQLVSREEPCSKIMDKALDTYNLLINYGCTTVYLIYSSLISACNIYRNFLGNLSHNVFLNSFVKCLKWIKLNG